MPSAEELRVEANVLLDRARGMLVHLGAADTGHGPHYSDSPAYMAVAETWHADLATYSALEVDP
jgi:hypothetical protein